MATSSDNLANKYQQQSAEEHVLNNPDTYTGSMEESTYITHVMDSKNERVIQKESRIIPGLFKLFDEGIVNCRDHYVRMAQAVAEKSDNVIPVTKINIKLSEDGVFELMNDGNGIDVAKHPTHKLWIPEMIFGHLRTSTNYDKKQKKIVGGKNGFGFKLVLIWSSEGIIETVDHVRGLMYKQKFEKNLSVIHPPKITKTKKKPYTKVTFKPDYARLGVDGINDDMRALIARRVHDIAAVTDKSVKVKFNDELVPVRHFPNYIDLYIGNKSDAKRIYEERGPRWEYAVALSPTDEFMQVSFVNGIYTAKGGKHVDYILNQIVRKLIASIRKKKKVDVKPSTIREQLMLFLRCDINNPGFDSQTKEYLTTPSSAFGSTCVVTDGFIDKVSKMGVCEAACALTEVKDRKAAKKTDGSKTRSIRGIPKLIDAHRAGTARSSECTLILCEGDSAKAGIVSGLSKSDRDIIGVYPMRGKLFNVRGETQKRIGENKEITEIKKILGLENGKKYDTPESIHSLRYGKILFMTDQDLDGSHIKGLGINLFDAQWPSLLQIPDFIGFMNTPILKASKGALTRSFYNEGEWEKWKASNDSSGWRVKYYKGLGTSTAKEFKAYFAEKRTVTFTEADTARDDLDKVFNKKRASDRKEWLRAYDRDLYLDTTNRKVSYADFLSKEMIHFSKYDNDRSIPNIMDGLKTSQRKILYTGLKRKLTKEIKVAQFSGSVSEISCYHHGEASLNGAIKCLCQDYVGSNNINLFEPKGQFGTRLQGGQDAASERYIHTNLSAITRHIFNEADDAVLRYLDDDGIMVEPMYYLPVIPMVLVNGCKGIGTGFSTEIQPYDPLKLCDYVESKLDVMEKKTDPMLPPELLPYYEGFLGTVTEVEKQKYLLKGVYSIVSDKEVHITELPVGIWTDDYKKYLETLLEAKTHLRDYKDMSTDTRVDITLQFASGSIESLTSKTSEFGCNKLEKYLKLYSTRTTTNMHLFNENDQLRKYDTPEAIIDDYMSRRLVGYADRKKYQLDKLEAEVLLISDKARFITGILEETIDLRRKKKDVVCAMLLNMNFAVINNDHEFKHLVRMPMDSVTEENVESLLKQKEMREKELDLLKKVSCVQLWRKDIRAVRDNYNLYKKCRISKQADVSCSESGSSKKITKIKKVKKIKKTKANC